MAQTQQKLPKGLPKRARNTRAKERRTAAWLRGNDRAAMHRLTNEDQARANRKRRANGEPTPWEVARGKRAARRAPLREAYQREQARLKRDQVLAST